MKNSKTRRLVICALFAALCFVATIIPIPMPMLHGYVNIGDCMVLLCAYTAGGFFGALSAGAGCALADVVMSYAVYAPATFVIKTLMALAAYVFFKNGFAFLNAVGCVIAEGIMVCGYLVFEYYLYGSGCLASIPGNLLQGGVNAVIAFVLVSVFANNKTLQNLSVCHKKTSDIDK